MFADVDRINPKYFDYLDRKIDYLNAQGFVPFIEVSRRDSSEAWKRYYTWPDSYARFIEYIFARYQANNALLSPIHFDTASESIPATEYMPAIEMALQQHGSPPFGTLLTANAATSTLLNWGDGSWVTLHQIGNSREHDFHWYLTQIFRAVYPQPALNGEPYYSGYYDARGRVGAGYKFGAREIPKRMTSTCALECTGASSPEAWPAISTARREYGAPMCSRKRPPRCGTPSNGAPPHK